MLLPELIGRVFIGLLLVATAAAVLSSVLFTKAPPLKRSLVTGVAAWVIASAALYYFSGPDRPIWWEVPLLLLPLSVVVWLIMWRSFAVYWRDDEDLAALAEAEAAKQWPTLPHEDGTGTAERLPPAGPQRLRPWPVRHWRGEFPLPVAYWVNSLLVVSMVTVLAAASLRALEAAGAPLQAVAAGALFFLFFSFALWAWGAVGTWRAATVHEDRGGSGTWAIAAQVMVVLGAFLTFVQVRSTVFQTMEMGVLAFGGDSLGPPAAVTVSEDGRTILIDGTLTSGTSGNFRDVVERSPRAATVLLDSPGGRQLEAMRIATSVRQRGLATRVERECMSACTFILLAGRGRTADPEARVGFHQPDFPGWSGGERRVAVLRMAEDYRQAGLGARFVDRALAAPPDQMWMPAHQELVAERVLTASELDGKPRQPRVYRQMAELAERINQGLPKQIGPTTRLERTETYGGTLVHHLTVLRPREEINRASARAVIGPGALRQICAVEANLDALEDGGNFVFFYRDVDGRPLFQITVDGCGAV